MKIAVIGKSAFGADVYKRLREAGHEVVVVCTEPDKNGRADLIALEAAKNDTPVLKLPKWRRKNPISGKWEVIPEVFEQYTAYGAELNVLPFCTQFIPSEVIDFPRHKTIIYHPSILPAHRGASAINWTLINGDSEAGLTLFWADDGVDTGPILLQRKCAVEENDTLNSLYKRFLYPEGVKATVDAVNLIAEGRAPRITQPEEGASYEPYITAKPELAQIDWAWRQCQLHNFIRGNDNVPGAWTTFNGQKVTLLGSSLWKRFDVPGNARAVEVEGVPGGVVWAHDKGLLFKASDGKYVNIDTLKFEDGKVIKASKYGATDGAEEKIELNEDEKLLISPLKEAWKAILNMDIDNETNFFDAGATSADLTRLLEEVNVISGMEFLTCEAYMAPTFGEFLNVLVSKLRGDDKPKLVFEKIEKDINGLHVTVPVQMFINGEFCDSESNRKMDTIDPSNEKVICQVPKASTKDVDRAVRCASEAFYYGEWSRMSARERGRLLFRLADLMEEHKQELATIESIDSGAVYTLALKTHVGMSIDVWRYFAGWTDKIELSSYICTHVT
ncbi:formyl transferase domain-containing protein [Ditylenchus destructor]|uniref:formyltetrahydrofolate dehydrogenase n=1 Tax=Ditylenchus destructor TaxID=166010 RepID=A0AAD4N6H5_9BILA|nr:formyl transferase domain-containing protein [Ditylenchus destructor]